MFFQAKIVKIALLTFLLNGCKLHVKMPPQGVFL